MKHLLAVLAIACAPAQAMDFNWQGDVLTLSGRVVQRDVARFATVSGVKQIILQDSPGGDVETATTIGYAIRDAKIRTLVQGYCNSACALIFLGGFERELAPRAAVGFHGCTRLDHGYAGRDNARLIGYVTFMTENKFNAGLADTVFHELRGDDLLVVQRSAVIMHRAGANTRVSHTGLELGVLTPKAEIKSTPYVRPLIVF